jgi:hypothetical protein
MWILSHRGSWKAPPEQNTLAAFERSFRCGFGVETDLRDAAGRLVVSHDPPSEAAPSFAPVLRAHRELAPGVPLALNIKADGLQPLLSELLRRYRVPEYFAFDMAVPDMRGYVAAGLRVFTRHSELEPSPACYGQAAGIWLDAFESDWFDEGVIVGHQRRGKRVCLVSPELHGRDHRPLWDRLRSMPRVSHRDLMLCTDHPEAAREFFDD